MKLFFTYGKKTIFLCGIDKKAIREAVKTKYRDVVKANEYLEKVFDISFSMPESVDASKLVKQYFKDDEIVGKNKLGDLVSSFFEQLHFKNPRRIKKILNKYLIIRRLKETEYSDNLVLPNILTENSGTLFETYLTLYLLILNEFEPENFKLLFNLSVKRINYVDSLKKSNLDENQIKSISDRNLLNYLKEESLNGIIVGNYEDKSLFRFYLANFTPNKVDSISSSIFRDKGFFKEHFNLEIKSYEYYFSVFMFQNEDDFIKDLKNMEISLMNYKKMISNLI
jgi:hypothetical protein